MSNGWPQTEGARPRLLMGETTTCQAPIGSPCFLPFTLLSTSLFIVIFKLNITMNNSTILLNFCIIF